jgi:hypothetical protein
MHKRTKKGIFDHNKRKNSHWLEVIFIFLLFFYFLFFFYFFFLFFHSTEKHRLFSKSFQKEVEILLICLKRIEKEKRIKIPRFVIYEIIKKIKKWKFFQYFSLFHFFINHTFGPVAKSIYLFILTQNYFIY